MSNTLLEIALKNRRLAEIKVIEETLMENNGIGKLFASLWGQESKKLVITDPDIYYADVRTIAIRLYEMGWRRE